MYPIKNPVKAREAVNIKVATFSPYFLKKIHHIFKNKIFLKKIEPIAF